MKIIFLISMLLLFINVFNIKAENKTDSYVVLLNKDTVYITPLKLRHSKIVCTIDGVKKKFQAKEILAYKVKDHIGESARACPIIIGFKRWLFLERDITGKVGLFYANTSQRDLSTPGGRTSATIFFYKKVGEPRGKIYKLISWKRLHRYLSDCHAYVNQLNSKESFKYLQEQIVFYNDNCK